MAMTALPAFTYDRHLHDPRAKTIRVLELQPSLNQADILQLQLHYADLEDPEVYYEAISYSWDGQTATEDVLCNGLQLKITRNLHAAFQTFRGHDSSQYLWADAVCIDQSDVKEKNSQVPLMGEIYQKAKVVKVWLGCDDTAIGCDVSKLLSAMSRVSQEFEDIDPSERHIGSTRLVALGVPLLKDPAWNALQQFLCASWFSRTWVMQEVALPEQAEFHIGLHNMAWSVFNEAIRIMFKMNVFVAIGVWRIGQTPRQWNPNDVTNQLLLILETRSACQTLQRHKLDLLQLLQYARSTKASDPKDKVYALLGLTNRIFNVEVPVPVDYSPGFSVEALYIHVAKLALESTDTLDILSMEQLELSPSRSRPILPSWVPDWSFGELATLDLLSKNPVTRDYKIAFDAARISITPKYCRIVNNSLELRGVIFDSADLVQCLQPVKLPRRFTHRKRLTLTLLLSHWINNLYEMAKIAGYGSKSAYPAGGSTKHAFLWTLFLGKPDFQGSTKLHDADVLRRWYKATTNGTRKLRIMRFFRMHHQPYAMAALGSWRYTMIGLLHRQYPGGEDINILDFFASRCMLRSMFRTKKGYIGLAPPSAKPGDSIALVCGGRVPLILREKPGKDKTWELVGDAYVHGIMYGEAFDERKCETIIIE